MVKTKKQEKNYSEEETIENNEDRLLETFIFTYKNTSIIVELLQNNHFFITKHFCQGTKTILTEKGPYSSYGKAKRVLESSFSKLKQKGYKLDTTTLRPSVTISLQLPKLQNFDAGTENFPKKLQKFLFDKPKIEEFLHRKMFDICCKPIVSITKAELIDSSYMLFKIEQMLLYNENFDINDLSQKFYSKIPHFLQNMKRAVIDSSEKIKEKAELLMEIEYFQYIFTNDTVPSKVVSVDFHSEVFSLINESVQSALLTSSPTKQVKVQKVYKVNSSPSSSIRGNQQLLWLKTQYYCIPHILSQGFLNFPIYFPSTPYEFNKGYYFADNICAILSESGEAVLLLCEVALGNTLKKFQPDFLFSDKNYDSVFGIGKAYPSEYKSIDEALFAFKFKSAITQFSFPFDLISVYDPDQIVAKYIVKVLIS